MYDNILNLAGQTIEMVEVSEDGEHNTITHVIITTTSGARLTINVAGLSPSPALQVEVNEPEQ